MSASSRESKTPRSFMRSPLYLRSPWWSAAYSSGLMIDTHAYLWRGTLFTSGSSAMIGTRRSPFAPCMNCDRRISSSSFFHCASAWSSWLYSNVGGASLDSGFSASGSERFPSSESESYSDDDCSESEYSAAVDGLVDIFVLSLPFRVVQ